MWADENSAGPGRHQRYPGLTCGSIRLSVVPATSVGAMSKHIDLPSARERNVQVESSRGQLEGGHVAPGLLPRLVRGRLERTSACHFRKYCFSYWRRQVRSST